MGSRPSWGFMIIIFYFNTVRISTLGWPKAEGSYTLESHCLCCKNFLTASPILNINLPVIGGENKQAIKTLQN